MFKNKLKLIGILVLLASANSIFATLLKLYTPETPIKLTIPIAGGYRS